MSEYTAFIGTGSVRGSQGIYTLSLNTDTGALRLLSQAPARDSGYVALSPDGATLYSVVESLSFQGQACSAVSAYHRNADDSLTYLNTQAVDGQLAAHVSVDPSGRQIYVSAYLTGKLNVFPVAQDGSLLPCCQVITDPNIGPLQAHIHCSMMTPDGRYLAVMEVGTDTVDLYDSANCYCKVFSLAFNGHVRPRHITFSDDGRFAYIITEISNEIYVCRYCPDETEKLQVIQVASTLPEDFQGMSFPAGIEISPDGTLLVATTRGPVPADAIVLYARDPESGRISAKQFTQTTGESPRDFAFSPDGAMLLVGLQKSDRMAVYAVDYSVPSLRLIDDQFPLPASSCVIFSSPSTAGTK